MAIRNKIDSNETSLYYAEEEALGVLPANPAWFPLEPNEYDDFGGELTLLARNPINSSRQRKKGVITDLDASGGFNQDFTQTNFQDLLQGVMFADTRTKPAYMVSGAGLQVIAATPTSLPGIVGIDLEAAGVIPGEWIFVGGDGGTGFVNPGNNGFKRIHSFVGSPAMALIDRSATPMVDEVAGGSVDIYLGKVIKNELGSLIKRRSYQLERQLGAPDTAAPTDVQAEYIKGAVPNEFTLNIATADKINADISFVAIDNEQRTATEGVKAGTRVPLVESDAFNTSSDFASMRLEVIDPLNEASVPLFAYLTELTITINNNVTPNKAVAVLGAFDVTAGTFAVSGEATAYFTTVEAVRAVRQNANVSLYAAVVKENAGFVIDLPLVALGDARLDVAQDEPITLPVAMDAATAVKINPDTDYTAMFVFFDNLPNVANP